MTMTTTNERTDLTCYEEWVTVNLTPLAGWVHVYAATGYPHGYVTEDCVGALLQESTKKVEVWTEKDGSYGEKTIGHDRITRVVFAIQIGDQDPTVVPIDDDDVLMGDEYFRSMSRSSYEEWMAKLDYRSEAEAVRARTGLGLAGEESRARR